MGYGEMKTENAYENLITICGIICSLLIFAYNLNSIYNVLAEFKEIKTKYQRYSNAINRFMRDKGIKTNLRKRINEYLNELWS